MAWFYDKERKKQLEIANITKIDNLPIYEITFKNKCNHCGSLLEKTVNLNMSKDSNEKKAINSFVMERSNEYLEKAIERALKTRNKKEKFILFNKKTLKPETVSYETLMKVVSK